jgi:hypothetical protein
VAELFGSWLDEISFRDLRNGNVEKIWSEPALVANAHLQYYFLPISILMNYKSPEMEGYIPCTDSRWRGDLRLFEDDKIDESDEEKCLIENRQRWVRK